MTEIGTDSCDIVTVAVASYDDPSKDRPSLERIGRAFSQLFGGLSGPTTMVKENLLLTPRVEQQEVRVTLARWGSVGADIGLLLWTGHGERDRQGVAQLSVSDALLDATVIASWIRNARFDRWLVILDTCFAASILDALYPVLNKAAISGSCALLGSSDETSPSDAGLFTKALMKVLEEGPTRRWWSSQDRFLEMDDVNRRLDEDLEKNAPLVGAAVVRLGGRRRAGRSFPNPFYRAAAVAVPLDEAHFLPKARGIEPGATGWFFTGREEALRRIVTWLTEAKDGIFLVTGPAGTGKSALVGRVVTLSVESYREDALTAGALVAADPDTLPPLGSVTAAFHARGKRVDELLDFLGDALDVHDARDFTDLLNSPTMTPGETTIAVDALDEASPGHAQRILGQVLAPLARSGVKVLIGSRPGVARWYEDFKVDPDHTVDLAAEAASESDIARYAERRLSDLRGSPYGNEPAVAMEIAEAVSNRSLSDPLPDGRRVGSFLVAHILTKTLAAGERLDLSPGWEERLPEGFAEALEVDLESYRERLGEELEREIRAVLEGIAWVEGAGVSRRLIPILTEAVTGHPVEGAHLSAILEHAAGHLVEAQTDGWAEYRLYHERLAQQLREPTRLRERVSGGADANVHRRICDALVDLGIAERWSTGDPYLSRSLPEHAARGGRLAELLQAPGYLQAAAPAALLRVLPLTADGVTGALTRTYRRASHGLHGAAPDERGLTLQFAAARSGETVNWSEMGRLSLRWLRGFPTREIETIFRANRADTLLAVAAVAGTTLAAVSDGHGGVEVWDLRTVTLAGGVKSRSGRYSPGAIADAPAETMVVTPLTSPNELPNDLLDLMSAAVTMGGGAEECSAVAIAEAAGQPILVAGYGDGSLRFVDLDTGGVLRDAVAAQSGEIAALATGERYGKPVVISGATDGTIRVWALPSGDPAGSEWNADPDGVTALAVYNTGGESILVSLGRSGTVRTWDLSSQDEVGENTGPVPGASDCLAVTRVGESWIAITGGRAYVQPWDLPGGTPTGDPVTWDGLSLMLALAADELGGRSVVTTSTMERAATGGLYNHVRVWDWEAGEGTELRGHTGGVARIATAKVNDRSVLVTLSDDLTLRVWDLEYLFDQADDGDNGQLLGHAGWVEAVATGRADGEDLAVTGGYDDGTVRVWDLATGTPRHAPMRGHAGNVTAIAIATVNGRQVAVSGGTDGTIRTWDLVEGLERETLTRDGVDQIVEIDVCDLGDSAVAVSAGADGAVRLWELGSSESAGGAPGPEKRRGSKKGREGNGKRIGKRAHGHEGIVWAVATGLVNGRPSAVSAGQDGSVRIWDLLSRKPAGKPLRGHDGYVRSVALSALDGAAVALSGGEDGNVCVWDLARGKTLYPALAGHTNTVRAVTCAHFGGRALVVSGGEDATLRIWDLATGRRVAVLHVLDRVSDISIAGAAIVVAAADRVACIDVDM